MKQNSYIFRLGIFAVIVTLFACHKSVSDSTQAPVTTPQTQHDSTPPIKTDTPVAPVLPYPAAPLTGCSYDPSYGDSIIFPQPTNGQDYIVTPVNSPGPGKYMAWPVGLAIDSVT